MEVFLEYCSLADDFLCGRFPDRARQAVRCKLTRFLKSLLFKNNKTRFGYHLPVPLIILSEKSGIQYLIDSGSIHGIEGKRYVAAES